MAEEVAGKNKGPKRGRRGGGGKPFQNKERKEEERHVHENSAVIKAFRTFQSELDAKHDKRERIIKLSRDVTIESKRVIFLLHRINSESQKESIIQEAEDKIKFIQRTLLSMISKELENEDIYRFLPAFSFGIQEYIEAVAFLLYLRDGRMLSEAIFKEQFMSLDDVIENQEENRKDAAKQKNEAKEEKEECGKVASSPKQDNSISALDHLHPIDFTVPPTDFFLGIADFTGEIMRLCINSVGSGNKELPFKLAGFLRQLFEGFQLIGYQAGREMSRKLHTLRQSLKKVENVCYTLQVRGFEMPKHMLLDAIETVEKQDRGDGLFLE